MVISWFVYLVYLLDLLEELVRDGKRAKFTPDFDTIQVCTCIKVEVPELRPHTQAQEREEPGYEVP